MTLFPDTQTQVSSDDTGRGRGPSRLEIVGVGIALAVGIGVVSLVGQSDYASDEPAGSSTSGGTTSAYARPTEALHGQTLADYLAEHYSDRVTRR